MTDLAPLPAAVLEDFRRWCSQRGVELAYLYGSRARGSSRSGSDYDIAVRAAPAASRSEEMVFEAAEALARMLAVPEDRIDVHDLDRMPPALQYRVLRDGIRLWEGSPGSHSSFFVRAMGIYLDQRYYDAGDLESMRRRIREGQFGHRPAVR